MYVLYCLFILKNLNKNSELFSFVNLAHSLCVVILYLQVIMIMALVQIEFNVVQHGNKNVEFSFNT